MEIKSGEGKSLIFGIMSLLIALMGNRVYVVSYSNYLTNRDYDEFKDLFEAFNVTNLLSYSTFSKISEKFINENGDIRESV